MGRSYSWYHADRHATYEKNDVLKFDGAYYTSADGLEKWGTNDNTSRYFNSYYTNSNWTVLAPICFGKVKDQAWAYAKPSTIVSGGTLDTYTIKYNANGGTGAPSNQTKTYGKALTLRTGIPTRTGYNFVCWNRESDGSGTTNFKPGGTYTGNQNTTFYAIWSPYKHTVKYNANGGSGAPDSQTKTYGSKLTLSSVKPTRTGHTFLGWGTSSTDTSVNYKAGGTYERDQDGGTYTLYAIWSPNTYTVSFNANGGSNAPESQTKTYGEDLVLTKSVPTRTNYTFLGWGTASNDTTVDYKAGATYTDNKAITLYAIWDRNNYNVTYKLNGGTNNSSNKTSVKQGTVLNLYEPTLEGHTFIGWHLNSSNGKYVTSIDSTNSSDITLYAEWEINTYTITINLNGGTYNGQSTVTDIEALYGSTINLFIPEKANNNFNKWSVAGLGTVSKDNLSFTVGAQNTTLKAVWGLEVLTVTYDANGGTLDRWEGGYTPPVYSEDGDEISSSATIELGGTNASVQYQYGDELAKYIIPTATRDYYEFLGWYCGDTKIESPYAVKEDINLIAKWQKIETVHTFSEDEYKKGLAYSFVKDGDSIRAEEGFVYVFKNGKFVRGSKN